MFKIQGISESGSEVEVVWNNGKFHCDSRVFRMMLRMKFREPFPIASSEGPFFTGAQKLTDPRAAFLQATSLMDSWKLVDGDVPSLGEVPPDAVT